MKQGKRSPLAVPPRLQVVWPRIILLSLYRFRTCACSDLKTYHMEEKMTTLSYIYMGESQFKSVRWNWGANERDLSHICLSRGRLFSPSLSCRGQGIGKHRGTICGWQKRENFSPLSKYASGQPALKQRQTLYICMTCRSFRKMTRFRQRLLLTQNGVTLGKCYS